MRLRDGSFIWLEGSPNIIRDADGEPIEVVSTYRDVTRRHELEDQLRLAQQATLASAQAARASEVRYRAMADVSRDMIARMDMNGVIRFVSPSCEAVLGYTQEELVGSTTISHTLPEDAEGVKSYFASLIAEGPDAPARPYTFRARRKDGQIVWLEGIPRILFDQDGKPQEMQDSARDVTARKELEVALANARVAAEAAAAAKADFLANMSHELRTPLNSIVGFTQLLAKSNALPPDERRHVDLVAKSSRSLLSVVNDILDFSSLEAGSIALEERSFSVAETVQSCMDSLVVQADAKNLGMQLDVSGGLEPWHLGDELRLHQILLNLISNAVKFTDNGSVGVSILAGDVVKGRQALRISVRDTGIGIPPDRQERLFGRFAQLDSSISRRYGGSGLGLAITKSLIELMDGRIGVASSEGQGATFWIELELSVADVADAAGLASPRGRQPSLPANSDRSVRILVVDDVDLNRELAVAYLASDSHSVDLAADGQEAIARARLGVYDLILMDVQMPGVDGLAATRAIRECFSARALPIIAMTAQALPNQIADCIDAGMNDYLAKPITPISLTAMVEKWTREVTEPGPSDAQPGDGLLELRQRFFARSRVDLASMRKLVATPAGLASQELRELVHRMAGTAGTVGYHAASVAALAVDQEMAEGRNPTRDTLDSLLLAVNEMLRAA